MQTVGCRQKMTSSDSRARATSFAVDSVGMLVELSTLMLEELYAAFLLPLSHLRLQGLQDTRMMYFGVQIIIGLSRNKINMSALWQVIISTVWNFQNLHSFHSGLKSSHSTAFARLLFPDIQCSGWTLPLSWAS